MKIKFICPNCNAVQELTEEIYCENCKRDFEYNINENEFKEILTIGEIIKVNNEIGVVTKSVGIKCKNCLFSKYEMFCDDIDCKKIYIKSLNIDKTFK